MERQALKIASWGDNVNVKVPVTNTKGESAAKLIEKLSAEGVVVNVTAIMSLDQVREVAEALSGDTAAIVSVFAGRIADTGADPVPHMEAARDILKAKPKAELLWASPRELLNLFQGRCGRLPYHHDDKQSACQAFACGQGLGRLFTGHSEDVLPRCERRGIRHLSIPAARGRAGND